MRYIALIAVGLTLFTCTACSQYRAALGSYGQEVSDATLHDALWTACRATPRGAVQRLYNSPDRLQAFEAVCAMALDNQ